VCFEDRIYIENELNRETSFKDIARFLCKDPTTISKEVRAHRLSDWYHKGTFYNAKKIPYTMGRKPDCKSYQFHSQRVPGGGRTPYSMALETLGKDALNAFQLRPMEPDQVNLTPKLIRFNH